MRPSTQGIYVNQSALPVDAFLPPRKLSEQERQSFVERRSQMYALCSPAERQCLVKLAGLYKAHRHQLVPTPNVFNDSALAMINYRYFSWADPKRREPGAVVRSLAQVSTAISKAERWHAKRSQHVFIRHLRALVNEKSDDVLLGVVQFCRALPLEVGWLYGQSAFEAQLADLAERCVTSRHAPALRRVEAARRCAERLPSSAWSTDLRDHMWGLLLDLAQADMPAALELVDEYVNRGQSPSLFSTISLHTMPELAYKLAVKFRPHRIVFATEMLRESIFYNSFKLDKVDASSRPVLDHVMDASCRLLAQWVVDSPDADMATTLRCMHHLFQFGNPADAYWRRIREVSLAAIEALPPDEQVRQLLLLAQVVFYETDAPAMAAQAHTLFRTCVARRIAQELGQGRGWRDAVSEMVDALSILESKALSRRNRRVAACPDHALLKTVEKALGDLVGQLLEREPSSGLENIVSLTLALGNEQLFRAHHELLRSLFEAHASAYPADAGEALKTLIQYCGYSQIDDQMYRKTLCQASFDLLLPVLEKISPADAGVARGGIGWSPRGPDI